MNDFFKFKIDLQCLQAVVESKTKTLHANCHDMLLQRMNMFKNVKALVSTFFLNNVMNNFTKIYIIINI